MTDAATGRRSLFEALKVPFDLKGVAHGALAYLAWEIGTSILGIESGVGVLRNVARGLLGLTVGPWAWGKGMWAFLALCLGIGALFGVACCRIAAMRLARDEGVGFFDALGFAMGNLAATVKAFAFLGAALGFFAAANLLAGVASAIPGVGPILMIVLLPLVLLSTLLLFLLAFGTVFGLPLVLPGLATERNGALDAVSRSFSYVFSRPALFGVYAVTVLGLATVLVLATDAMMMMGWRTFTTTMADDGTFVDAVARGMGGAMAMEYPNFKGAEESWGAGIVTFGWFSLFHLLLKGWVVYYLFGGATAAYFALRNDVDGTEDEEIWIEGEQEDGFGEPEPPDPA
ncbi:MAG: hypothetical protein ACYTDX_10460 [Planctomycetota bacterium]|jgi:hypothetical protein